MNDPEKKPRIDSKLKTLPEDRQAHIYEMLQDKSLAEVRKELRADGLDTSPAALSEFRSWYRLRLINAKRESRALQLMDMLKQEKPELSEAELFQYGQMFFSTQALEEEDPKTWVNVQQLTTSKNLEEAKLELKKQAEARQGEKLTVEKRKLALLEKKAAAFDRIQAAQEQAKKTKGGLTRETLEKIEQELKLF